MMSHFSKNLFKEVKNIKTWILFSKFVTLIKMWNLVWEIIILCFKTFLSRCWVVWMSNSCLSSVSFVLRVVQSTQYNQLTMFIPITHHSSYLHFFYFGFLLCMTKISGTIISETNFFGGQLVFKLGTFWALY